MIDVLIVNESRVVREGLRALLEHDDGIGAVGMARDAADSLTFASALEPDVVIVDSSETCQALVNELPEARVLVLAPDDSAAMDSIAAGATGVLDQRTTGRELLVTTVKQVAAGTYSVPDGLASRVFAGVRANAVRASAVGRSRLTEREQQVLTLYAQGLSYADIAECLGNRPLTVRNTLYRVQNRLGTKSKQALVLYAVRNGLLE